MFNLAPLNPFRFADPRLNDLDREPGYKQFNDYQDRKSFCQKWQVADETVLQVLSDYAFTAKVIDAETGAEVEELTPVQKETTIIGQTFAVYEVPVVFADLLGVYFIRVQYNDGTNDYILDSEPFEVAESWPRTFLAKYRNSENNFSVVFDTGVEFAIRIDGTLSDFTPEANDLIYIDQNQNATLIDSLPFRSFVLYVGDASGVPFWVLDKVNRVLSCNIVQILDVPFSGYFTKKDGASWNVERESEYAYVGATLEVVPTVNNFTERFITEGGGLIGGGRQMIQRVHNITNLSGAVAISGKFTDKTLIEKICIVRSGAIFNLAVGVTPGGSEIAEFQIADVVTTVLVNHLLTAETTLHLSGISTASFISIIYKQLDDTSSNSGPVAPGNVGKGATLIYHFNSPEELDAAFDIVSGLGRTGSTWETWAIADGRNGTDDMGGIFPLGYKFGEYELGAAGGNAEITLTVEQLPPHDHDYRTAVGEAYKRGNTGSRFFDNNLPAKTDKTGSGDPVNILPPYKVKLWVTKIAD